MTFLKGIKLKNILMLTIAGIINAIGVTIFISPVNLYDSGISGTSILLWQQTGITMSIFLVLLNVPLFIYGTKKQGKLFTIYAIYTVIIYSISAWLINDILPIDVSVASPIAQKDLLLCAVFGGMISGLGSGIAIRYGGAMDGIEVMAVIFAKKIGVSVGAFVMAYNALLYITCGLIKEDWILPLYSIVTYYAGLKTIDFIVDGLDRAKSAMIITEHPTEVCEALAYHFETGSTRIKATGGYSNREKTMVYFIVNRFQVTKMKNIVHEIDPKAFITISEVADVYSVNNK
ncbi:MAG: YitT family protein [Clostridia bacterium]|nr:YitT family protein [Clostridia bacterium]